MPQTFSYLEFNCNIENPFLRKFFPKNSIFNLPIWKLEGNKSSEVLIMINGFLEGVGGVQNRHEKLIDIRYGAIAKKLLNDKGITSVLLPLPFHFNRSFDVIGEDEFAPLSRLTKSGTYLYYGGFTQIVNDVEKLIQDIEANPARFGLQESIPIKFHLLGYSIGGVAAIGAALNLKRGDSPKLESLLVLLSAWNIAEIKPQAIERTFGERFGFSSEMWATMLNQLEEIREVTNPVFKKLIWNEGGAIEFKTCAKRVFFLHGFNDEVFTQTHTEATRQEVLEMMDKCTFINLPIDHNAIRSTEEIAGYVSTFICNGR
ncbi:MAG: hypothetical protein FJX80_09520 [Bacteroidetes bacterium]|nr:hypothetical protein [Bacteroidota bacterium]